MPMKEPPHPGLSVRHDCLEPLGISVTKGASILGVTHQALNNQRGSKRSSFTSRSSAQRCVYPLVAHLCQPALEGFRAGRRYGLDNADVSNAVLAQ